MNHNLKVRKIGPVLEPTRNSFEKKAVLNPAVYQEGDLIHLFYRAVSEENISVIGYAKLRVTGEIIERSPKPLLQPEFDYEARGLEDPRIVKIGDTFYLTYVAHDGKNALTAYATSADLKNFKKQGILSPRLTYHEAVQLFRESEKKRLKDAYYFFASYYEEGAGPDVLLWHKDVILFPKKIRGKFAVLHRVLPDIQIAFFENFSDLTPEYWQKYFRNLSKYVVLENKHWFESRHIGGGCPPVETKDGWLVIFHAVEEINEGRVYHAGAALLDRKNPRRVLGKLHEPLFSPVEPWEKSGLVSNVVFPTGSALFGETLYIYYGAADRAVGAAALNLNELLQTLKDPRLGHNNHGTNE